MTTVLQSGWFAVLATFVALNTIMYCALAVAKVLPKVYVTDWLPRRNRRSQTRSIYPDGFGEPADATGTSDAAEGRSDDERLEPVG